MYLIDFSIFLIKVQVNTESGIVAKSYGNRKVALIWVLIGGRGLHVWFIAMVSWQRRPDRNNQPDAQNRADSPANNGKWHTKELSDSPCLNFPQLRTAHKEDLIDTGGKEED